ncbi:hypothetical protein CON15_19445 [Bacillus cereus]|uniref:Uncharacterized protein n=1 Tax=Bacillus thuringiensis TaxID=1428 RepID=A0AB36VG36_BACTU|nr:MULTISPECIES: hypothetical protein [Bacillus cereus group]PDZ55717.1 hypothetical protein CON15_19445 [Bacillus cereus]PFO26207.1 hypothetical protein COJ78_29330 [Bacillus thuringiensis]PFS40337.1 hypothetical protein COK48_00400 [Bacillus thuringiensis]PFS58206.1 hypothetical protein COK64_17655 [Bacillus thuringiensis]PGZ04956.1 hypothetical protein COE48_05070 [Bacillus thuringiensis]
MKLGIKIGIFKKKNDAVLNHLNEWGGAVYDSAYKYYSNMAKNEGENVLKMFDDWWHGKYNKKEYIARYTEEECEVADSIIFTAISGGFG